MDASLAGGALTPGMGDMREMRRSGANLAVRIVTGACGAVLLAGLLIFAYVGVRPPFVFYPDNVVSERPDLLMRGSFAFERVTLTAPDGVAISAWWAPNPNDDAPTILLLPTAHGDLGHRMVWIKKAVDEGFHVFAIDYRGFGESEGRPSAGGFHRDAEAAYRWLIDTKAVSADRLIVVGRSVGGAVAAHLAQRRDVGLVVLDSTFTHIADAAAAQIRAASWRGLPMFLIRAVYWNTNLNTIHRVTDIEAPILIMHSDDDPYAPFSQACTIFEAAGDNASLRKIRGGPDAVIDHNPDTYFVYIKTAYQNDQSGERDLSQALCEPS